MGVKRDDRFKDLNIEDKLDLIVYVTQLNAEIREKNKTLPKEEKEKELNLSYILKRYEKIKKKDEIKNFREDHDCKYCLYFEEPRRCMAVKHCPLDDVSKSDYRDVYEERKYITCPKYDKYKPCPYGNEVGNCFGYCARDIVKEIKQKNEAKKRRCE